MNATTIVEVSDQDLHPSHPRHALRFISKEEFIEKWGSGTLRKSTRLGFNTHETYLQERTKFEFGLGFEIIPSSRVAYSDIELVSCQGMTELGWHAERMIELRHFESDLFICKKFEVEYSSGVKRQGAGILVAQTSAKWIPAGQMVFSIVTENINNKYQPAINPF